MLLLLLPSIALAAVAIPLVASYLITSETAWVVAVGYALLIGSYAYGSTQQRVAASRQRDRERQAHNDSLQDRTVTGVSTNAPFRYIIGECRVGSDIVAMFTNGDRDQYRYLVCVHAAHECDSVLEYWVGGKALGTLDANGWVTSGDYYTSKHTAVSESFTGTSFTLAHTPVAGTVRVRYWASVYTSDGYENQEVTQAHTLSGSTVTVPKSRAYTVYYDWVEPFPMVRVKTHLGGAADPVDALLAAQFPSQWASTAVLRGFCYSVVMLNLDQPEFQSGLVPIEAKIRGMKLHDPRNGAYPLDTPVWSQNPALAVLWYLQSDLCEVEQSDIPLADYITAANVCEPITGCTYSQTSWTVTVAKVAHGRIVGEMVDMQFLTGTALDGYFEVLTVPDADHFTYTANIWNGTGYTVDSRTTSGNCTIGGLYTVNGTISSDQEPDTVLDQLAQCMAGGIVRTTWSCWAGAYTAPVMALTQDDIVGAFSTVGGTPAKDLINGVRGQYISPENSYVVTDFTPYQNAAYVAADGLEKWADMNFPFTDSVHRVHNLARIMCEDQRNGFTLKAQFSLKAYAVKIGQRVTFTGAFVGQSAKVYRLTDRAFSIDGGLNLTFKEDAAATYDKANATSPEVTPNTSLPSPWSISAPASLVFSQDVLYPERAKLNWPEVFNVYAHQFGLEYMGTQHSTWQKLAPISGVSMVIDGLPPGTYQFRVRTINPILNVKSSYTSVEGEMRVMPVPNVSGLEIFGRGNSMVFGGKHCRLAWRKSSLWQAYELGSETYGGDSGGRDYFWKDYVVKVYSAAGVLLRTEYVGDENYIYTYEHNAEDHGGTAARDFTIKVWQRGKYNQLSPIAATISPSNTVPSLPTLYVLEGTDTVTFTYNEPTDLDWAGIKIWMSTSSGFTPAAANLAYDGVDAAATISGIVPNTVYYYKYAVKDEFGDSATSAQGSFVTSLSNQSLVSADAVASISLSPHGSNRNDGLGQDYGGGALLSSVLFQLPQNPVPIKLSAAATGVMTRSATPLTFSNYDTQAQAIKNLRKLTGTVSISSAGVITGTGTLFTTELANGDRLLLGSAHGSGSFVNCSGFNGFRPVQVNAPTTDTACTLKTTGTAPYKDTAFSYSGEVWAYTEADGGVSMPYNEVINASTAFDSRAHAAFVREFTQAEMNTMIAAGATHIFIFSTAREASGGAPAASVYSCERNVIMASVELT
jgi:hypothetical protein